MARGRGRGREMVIGARWGDLAGAANSEVGAR